MRQHRFTYFKCTSDTDTGDMKCSVCKIVVPYGEDYSVECGGPHVAYPHTPGSLYDCPSCETINALDPEWG